MLSIKQKRVAISNVNPEGDHSRDTVLIQASGKSFGMFDMTSIHGEDAYDIYTKLMNAINK